MDNENKEQIRINSINGPAHLGNGDINTYHIGSSIGQNDISRLSELLQNSPEALGLVARLIQELSHLTVSNANLTRKVEELEGLFKKREELVLDPETKTYLWKDNYGSRHQCCPVCWGNSEKRIPLQENDSDGPSGAFCPSCNSVFPIYREPPAGNAYLHMLQKRR